ncbi:outer membrane protein assembly factor BamA [Bisgaard Taxon 10/6]|uniref:Outer membrane protein assembly factor BamA n=1 Tax=Exercitatus varius TaxID=67857 RepID=A0ABT6EN05_9PAST|nr:outer membrane protein assembly factor BamA [Exercitatus varius]MDG2939490.1 outer membrane protein assembly factor BamA [Exercitatus varius]MDG2944920.1 outer membrane protein assembly factor BamA [Exercitatus varius]
MKKLLVASLLFGSASAYAAPFVVQDIRIDGVQSGAEGKVLAGLPVQVGKRVTDSDIANVVKTLYSRGYDNVQASREGNTLLISVTQQPVIADVTVSGNDSIPTEALKENLDNNGLKAGEVLNREKLNAFAKSLEDHYYSTGRYNAKVEPVVNNLPNNRAEVKLQVTENDVAKLKEITFDGNNAFDSDTLREQMELSEDAWYKLFGAKFTTEDMNKDLQTLTDYYQNRGYAKARVTPDVKLNDEKTEVRLGLKVEEGDRYTLKSARIVGDVGGMQNELQPLVNSLHLNEELRRNEIVDVEQNIKNKLAEQGYAMAQVNISPSLDEENKTADITYVVDAGRRYSVRQIRFEGNTVSADSTLRQEMRQQEGTWLSSQLVELGKTRLDRTGFYETVEYRNEPVKGSDDEVDVIYKVKERNTGSINFGIGYGTESGLSYQASIKQDNFLGMGSSISLGGSRNDYGTSVDLAYNEPYFTKDGVSLGGNVFYQTYDNSDTDDNVASYKRKTYGLNLTLGFPVNENNAYYIGAGYAYNKLSNISPEYTRNLYRESMGYDGWEFKSHDYTVSAGWNYNSLNRGYFPTKGVKATVGGTVTVPGSDNKFYKLSAEATGYYPLNREHSWVLSGRASAAYANGFNGKRLPFYQNYNLGGIGTIRGFSYGGFGPQAIYADKNGDYNLVNDDVVGGNAMATASVELIVPTPFVAEKNQNSVRTSLFVDAGSLWNTKWSDADKARFPTLPDYGDPSRIRASAGVAFQWQSPIGPLVFSYAKPIKKYDEDDVEQFQFSIGGSF